MRWMSYWETRLCPANDHCLPGWPETTLEEIIGDLLEADFWTARMSAPILTPAHDNVLYHSLSALASAEVNFWFTCRRKRLVSRADGCGERCRMTFLATSAS